MSEYTVVIYAKVNAADADDALTWAMQRHARGIGIDGRIVVKEGAKALVDWSPLRGRRVNKKHG